MIRAAVESDSEGLAELYNHYVRHTHTTFETEPVSGAEMGSRVSACAVRWKGRAAYRFSVESTIYLADGCGGRGLGVLLYRELLDQLRNRGMHAILAGIALPNEASVALHEKLGFEKVAHIREVGRKFEEWIDVGYWQLVLA